MFVSFADKIKKFLKSHLTYTPILQKIGVLNTMCYPFLPSHTIFITKKVLVKIEDQRIIGTSNL